MRKSLLKTPPSGLGSSLAHPPAALVAVAGRRPPARRNGSTPYTGVPRVRVAVEETVEGELGELAARIRLLEGLVGRTDIADCTQHALQWLADSLNRPKSICLVRPAGEQALFVSGACGFPLPALSSFAVSIEDWGNPLVNALTNRKAIFFPSAHSAADRRRRPSTPFEDAAFHALPLGSGTDEAFALLLVGGDAPVQADILWFTIVFSQKLDQILRQQTLVEGDRKQGRERSLLYSIINAVTDPILLTDAEGRLLIANARALTLFTASEEESEGRRSAVRMNNMLLSSALSSKAIEETGAT